MEPHVGDSKHFPWHRRARSRVGRHIAQATQKIFTSLPALEQGFGTPTITTLQWKHEALAGHRAVHLTDLHLDRYLPRHAALVSSVAALSPDWIFITGDLLNVPSGLPHLFRFLGELRQLAPMYLTLGNHDHYSGVPVDEFALQADRHKIQLLLNQTTFVPLRKGELGIVGLDDPSIHKADVSCIPKLRRPNRFTLLLAHAPNVLDLLTPDHPVDFILCGHSHGGQWDVPGLTSWWLPYGCAGRQAGHHTKHGHRLYVNRGVGWSLLPWRINCPPEIVLMEWVA
jgi:predicted MPP superfamily phosphohydrolase